MSALPQPPPPPMWSKKTAAPQPLFARIVAPSSPSSNMTAAATAAGATTTAIRPLGRATGTVPTVPSQAAPAEHDPSATSIPPSMTQDVPVSASQVHSVVAVAPSSVMTSAATRSPSRTEASNLIAEAEKVPIDKAAPTGTETGAERVATATTAAAATYSSSRPSQTHFSAADVVAAGINEQTLQLPSPVYCAEWISETHILVAAGGGGRRFGMANVVILLEISTGASASMAAAGHDGINKGKSNHSVSSVNNTASETAPVWRFVHALDLGGDVPWCASSFLPLAAERGTGLHAKLDAAAAAGDTQLASSLIGFVALSSVATFTLVGICKANGGSSYELRRLARVEVPNDPRNPDKKPITLVHNALVVAHDMNGVLLYDLATLIPTTSSTSGNSSSSFSSSGASVDNVVEGAEPLASWALPARVNDLHANRVNILHAKARGAAGHGSGSHSRARSRSIAAGAGVVMGEEDRAEYTALVLEYALIAVVVQDKTLRVGSFRLRRNYRCNTDDERAASSGARGAADGGYEEEKEDAQEKGRQSDARDKCHYKIHEGAVLTGKDAHLPFSPMGSSMRLVRVFGLENVVGEQAQEAARRTLALASLQLQQQRQEGRRSAAESIQATTATEVITVVADKAPLASLLLVAYDSVGNQSYFTQLDVQLSLKLKRKSASSSNSGDVDGNGKSGRGMYAPPELHVRLVADPSPILKDCITSLSRIQDSALASQDGTSRPQNIYGAFVPTRWLVGSVEGWVASVRLAHVSGTSHKKAEVTQKIVYELDKLRPSLLKAEAARFPALHKEPVSCVAVSTRNDVVSTDISQHVIISTLPMPLQEDSEGGNAREQQQQQRQRYHEARKASLHKGTLEPSSWIAKRPGLELFPSGAQDEIFPQWLSSQSHRMLLFLASVFIVFFAIVVSR